MLLEEFDPARQAVINPSQICTAMDGFPKIGVSCFSHITLQRLADELGGTKIAAVSCASMEIPIYRVSYKESDVALFLTPVGAPACVAILEEIFALGLEKLVLFGTCGVLDASIGDCSIILPTFALRDEGTGFHYAPPSDELPVNPKHREEFFRLLEECGCHYTTGKTWTTDAAYRETPEKVKRRKEAGCICVDMECSAVAALAQFREKEVLHFFYAADNLDAESWDARSLSNHANLEEKDRIATLAMEAAVRILKK